MGFELALNLANHNQTEAVGGQLISVCHRGLITLEGELGAGKTTLVRGMLRALGWQKPVKSPTFTLLETYTIQGRVVYHVDLYRLQSARELEELGAREWFSEEHLCLLEWPQRAYGFIPDASVAVTLEYLDQGRKARFAFQDADMGKIFLRQASDAKP